MISIGFGGKKKTQTPKKPSKNQRLANEQTKNTSKLKQNRQKEKWNNLQERGNKSKISRRKTAFRKQEKTRKYYSFKTG